MERSRNCAERGEGGMPSREARPWPEELSDVDIDVPIETLFQVLSRVMRKIVCRQLKEALLCNGGIAESGLQMPHVHVLLVVPLGACDTALG